MNVCLVYENKQKSPSQPADSNQYLLWGNIANLGNMESNMVILFLKLGILMPYLVNIFIISILMSVISIFKDGVWPIVLVSSFWILRLFSLFQFFHFLLLFLVWGFDSCFYPVTIVAIWSVSSCALDFFFNLNVFSAILSFASFFSCSMLSSSFVSISVLVQISFVSF